MTFCRSSCARLKHFDGPWPNASPAVGREWIPAETCASGHADASRVAFVAFVAFMACASGVCVSWIFMVFLCPVVFSKATATAAAT